MTEETRIIGKMGAKIAEEHVSPMIAQYLGIKEVHNGALLFFRMGDFYELFFEDAEIAASALDIVLTKRGKHRGADIPMCGVPVHSYENYLQRLIRAGFKVAICEQIETPETAKKRGSKAIVKREVVRIITPGTLIEDTLLEARVNNYLLSLAKAQDQLAVSWADVSTGFVSVSQVVGNSLSNELGRLSPSEILVSNILLEAEDLREVFNDWRAELTVLPASSFDSQIAERRLKEIYSISTLESFGEYSRAEISALGALLDYVELTQKVGVPKLKPPMRTLTSNTMVVDSATRRNLELSRSLGGDRQGGLLSAIDLTVTSVGARLLSARVGSPSTNITEIESRLENVTFFVNQNELRGLVRQTLKKCPDIERAMSRITSCRGGPRDLLAIRDGLTAGHKILGLLLDSGVSERPSEMIKICQNLGKHSAITDKLCDALAEELPLLARGGNFIAPGFDKNLDELRIMRDESRRHIALMQKNYATETEIPSLKIRHNNVLGYFVEVTKTHADKLLENTDNRFIHRQTMVNAVRFTTPELGVLESNLSSAAERALAYELEMFHFFCAEVGSEAVSISKAAEAIAHIDVSAGLAELAVIRRYARPIIDNSISFEVVGARHPVVEQALERGGDRAFVSNDCHLVDGKRLWLMTGPNMAGKSTFLRQNALIAVMAQMGSYVPADSARIGIIDQLFSRVGAADDLARGRSTFMVEMVEAATILNQAGPRSLVILDEIGRGTATNDGLSIAWAVAEHLHEVNKCRALFATHYHELTALSASLENLANRTMRVREWQGQVVFLYEVSPGAADRSYGIHVAKLAGLPPSVIGRAIDVLHRIEEDQRATPKAHFLGDLPLFSLSEEGNGSHGISDKVNSVLAALADINPDQMSPREALDLVYRLIAINRGSEESGG